MKRIVIGHLCILAAGFAVFFGLRGLHIRSDALYYVVTAATYLGIGMWASLVIAQRNGVALAVGLGLVTIMHAILYWRLASANEWLGEVAVLFLVAFGTLGVFIGYGIGELIKLYKPIKPSASHQ